VCLSYRQWECVLFCIIEFTFMADFIKQMVTMQTWQRELNYYELGKINHQGSIMCVKSLGKWSSFLPFWI
jgi:hypothetical protein